MADTLKLDAARLAEIERRVVKADIDYSCGGETEVVVYVTVRHGDVTSLLQAARDGLRYHALIEAHNAGCVEVCDDNRSGPTDEPGRSSMCAAFGRMTPPRLCPECPRHDMIDVDVAQGEVAQ